jgi:hypothetical protein
VLTVPADVTVEQTNRDGTPVDIGQATATDICDADPDIASDAPAVFPLGRTTVTWTATDDSGNQSSGTQTVTVEDTTPPVLTVPADVTVEQTNRDGTPVDIGQATATDICDADPDIASDAPAVFPLGSTTVTWTATDDSGNQSSGTQTVTVEDTTPPVLTVPADVTVEQTNRDGTPVDIGQATATDICDADPDIASDAPAVFPLGSTTVTWTATDDSGNQSSGTQTVTVEDTTPPVLTVPADVTVSTLDWNGAVVNIGQAIAADICDADPAITDDAPAFFPLGTTVVTWTTTDASGNVSTGTQRVTVNIDNRAPVVGAITAPTDPIPLELATITASASCTDENLNDWHTAVWDWGDGSSDADTVDGGWTSCTHTYTGPGVYQITLTVTDRGALTGQSYFQYVVVYDRDGGFVSGGGWIMSPPGAYRPDPALTGKANFGFSAKYKKGANVPTGNAQFQFKAGNLNFHSDSYDWLVIAGAKAQFKGTGAINGSGQYGFILMAIDGQLQGRDSPDKFRIKIWNKATDELIYDNQLGASETDDPTTEIGGGSIVIHR